MVITGNSNISLPLGGGVSTNFRIICDVIYGHEKVKHREMEIVKAEEYLKTAICDYE